MATSTEGTLRAIYRVDGMTCEGCARSVANAIRRQLPEVEVNVSLEQRTVTVLGPHDAETVARAVKDAAFSWGGPAQ